MLKHWILEGKTPVQCDLMTWARWFEKAERHVAQNKNGDVRVSTVFVGIDLGYGREGSRPLLYETMIFGGEYDQWQDLCATYDQALVMHAKACELAGVPYKDDGSNAAGDESSK